MAQSGGGGSLTRKSKKDDVEALLSDFDNLDPNASTQSATSKGAERTTSNLTGQALNRKVGKNNSSSSSADMTSANAVLPNAANAVSSSTQSNDAAQLLLDDLDDLVKQRRAPTPKKTLSGSASPALSQPTSSISSVANRKSGNVNLTGGDNAPFSSVPPASDALSPAEGGNSATLPAASTHALSSNSPDSPSNVSAGAAQSSSSWGTWWSSATKLADQARAELEKRAAQVQSQVAETTAAAAAAANRVDQANETGFGDRSGADATEGSGGATAAVPWQLAQNVNSFLKSHGGDLNKIRSDLGKVGMKRWNEILNVVVPPIESHEVLSITLSHDMAGFEGVPDVVFQVLQRVMEAHASSHNAEQQLIVNKAPERKSSTGASMPKATTDDGDEGETPNAGAAVQPDLRPVTGLSEAWKLAESRLDELVEAHSAAATGHGKSPASAAEKQVATDGAALPITTCPLFVRIQPVIDELPGLPRTMSTSNAKADGAATHLFLAIVLRDPTNGLTHRTLSQPLLKSYALLSFEENPWAEDLLSESLQGALGSVGLEYVRSRMQAQSEALSKAASLDPVSARDSEGVASAT